MSLKTGMYQCPNCAAVRKSMTKIDKENILSEWLITYECGSELSYNYKTTEYKWNIKCQHKTNSSKR